MALTTCSVNTGVISSLDDKPNSVGGLSAAQFKAKFDEAATGVKNYLNNTLIPEIEPKSAVLTATHDLSVAGTQSIAVSFLAKTIKITAIVANEANKDSEGMWADNLLGISGGYCVCNNSNAAGANKKYAFDDRICAIIESDGNYTTAVLSTVSATEIALNWAKTGSGATGTVTLMIHISNN